LSEQLLHFFVWLLWTKAIYISVIRRQSNSQRSDDIPTHPTPKNSECKNPLEKFLPHLDFLGLGWLPPHYLPKGQPINSEYYSSLLVQLKDILKEKLLRKVTNGVLFLHDNAPAHRALATQKKLAYLGFLCLDNPPCSPDLAPADYHLFPGLKNN
jgi:histone-lysine N-methyltransferase SETMAR